VQVVGELNIVIFSKDRACQLDLLLRSISVFFPVDDQVRILYTASGKEYDDGYAIAKQKHQYAMWVDERQPTEQYGSGFRAWVKQLIDPGKPYTMFLVDDNVFKEPFSMETNERFQTFKARNDVSCFSLRMHPGIRYCYTERRECPTPTFTEPGTWVWRSSISDWAYSMSCDGHIFNTADIFPLVHSLPYANPNTFEGILANHPIGKTYMMCLDKSPVMNLPVNKVQTVNGNHCGSIRADYLNDQYLRRGKRIDLAPLVGFNNYACHQEVPLTFLE
jgi:hypothetical protein